MPEFLVAIDFLNRTKLVQFEASDVNDFHNAIAEKIGRQWSSFRITWYHSAFDRFMDLDDIGVVPKQVMVKPVEWYVVSVHLSNLPLSPVCLPSTPARQA
jgi:hypothetical protein